MVRVGWQRGGGAGAARRRRHQRIVNHRVVCILLRQLLTVWLAIGSCGSAGREPRAQGRAAQGRRLVRYGCWNGEGLEGRCAPATAPIRAAEAHKQQQARLATPRAAAHEEDSTAQSSTHPSEGAGATAPTPVCVLPSREGMPPLRTATTSGSLRIS